MHQCTRKVIFKKNVKTAKIIKETDYLADSSPFANISKNLCSKNEL